MTGPTTSHPLHPRNIHLERTRSVRPTRRHPSHPARRVLSLLALATMMIFASATAANAETTATVDTGWQQVMTDGGVGGTSIDGPFVFHANKVTKVTVTDAYCHGDAFTVLDQGSSIGDTSAVPDDLRTCSPRFYLSETVRADASMMDPTFSHGTFYVGPGEHSLDFVNKTIWNGTDAGSVAFFRLETVPLTKADCEAKGWQDFGSLFSNQGQCVSLSMSLEHQVSANIGAVGFATSPFGTVARGLTPPSPNWHKWTGSFLHSTTYTARRTTPITQADPGHEVLTVTVPVSLTGKDTAVPAVTTVTMTMTAQPRAFSLIGLGQYGSLGNTAWELVGDPTITDPGQVTTWTFRSTAPITPGIAYEPIVISFDYGNNSAVQDAIYTFDRPSTASVSATADGYSTGTGSGWFQP